MGKRGRSGKRAVYPFASIRAGKSRVVSGDKPASVRAAACQHARKYGGRFSCEAVDGFVVVRRLA